MPIVKQHFAKQHTCCFAWQIYRIIDPKLSARCSQLSEHSNTKTPQTLDSYANQRARATSAPWIKKPSPTQRNLDQMPGPEDNNENYEEIIKVPL